MDLLNKTKNQKGVRGDLQRYGGKWVALMGWKVVDMSNSLDTLMQQLKKKNLAQKVSVMLVPRKDEGPYILFAHQG